MKKSFNSNAAGIDISSREHVVAVPEDRDNQSVKKYSTFTADLRRLILWLKKCKIDTVAMESTGVYWYHLYTMLLDTDIEVYLVNARHVKKVPGRKSDINDAQWLQQLHSYGLLNACFQPDNLTRALRTVTRQRKQIVQDMSTQTLRMHKALEQMNIKLHNVLSDITGKTGRAMIKAILEGQRDSEKLYKNVDPNVKASKEDILKSLEGNWREEQLFTLKIAYDQLLFLESQLGQCDQEAEKIISRFTTKVNKKVKPKPKKSKQPKFNVEQYLVNIYGVDVTNIPGIKATAGLTILSETSPHLQEKFPTDKQFLSWTNTVPDNDITGGKIVKSRVKKKKNKTGQAFREAANTLWRSQCPLGDMLRKRKAKKGAKSAIVYMARKLASIYYKMVTEKVEYDESQIVKNRKAYLENKLKYLTLISEKIKLQLTENQVLAPVVI